MRHVARVERAVPTGPCRDEIDHRDLELERGTQGAIVRLIDRAGSVRIEEPEIRLLVPVRRLRRRHDRERRRAALHRRAEDPLHVAQKWHARASVREALVEAAGIRNVVAVLRAEHVEREEARHPHVVVAHAPILRLRSASPEAKNRGDLRTTCECHEVRLARPHCERQRRLESPLHASHGARVDCARDRHVRTDDSCA